jgi:hypothetical protein
VDSFDSSWLLPQQEGEVFHTAKKRLRRFQGMALSVRQDQTLSNTRCTLPVGTTSVLALAVVRRQREIIGNSLYTSARYAMRWWRFAGRTRYASYRTPG